jgi:hypothetical protein
MGACNCINNSESKGDIIMMDNGRAKEISNYFYSNY